MTFILTDPHRPYGVEIECQLAGNLDSWHSFAQKATNSGIETRIEDYNHSIRPYWKIVHDSSVYSGSGNSRYGEEPNCDYCEEGERRRPCDDGDDCPMRMGRPDPDYVLEWYESAMDRPVEERTRDDVAEWNCEYCEEDRGRWVNPCDLGEDCPDYVYSDDDRYGHDSPIWDGPFCGRELVSPILIGETGVKQIYDLTDLACCEFGADADHSCGLHVHHSASDFDLAAWKRLVKLYAVLQDGIETQIDRERVANEYCYRLLSNGPNPVDLEALFRRIDEARRVDDIYRVIPHRGALNIGAYAVYGTVEFRGHQGTVIGDDINHWVALTQALMYSARNMADDPAIPRPEPVLQSPLFSLPRRDQLSLLCDMLPGGKVMRSFAFDKQRRMGHWSRSGGLSDGQITVTQPQDVRPASILDSEPTPSRGTILPGTALPLVYPARLYPEPEPTAPAAAALLPDVNPAVTQPILLDLVAITCGATAVCNNCRYEFSEQCNCLDAYQHDRWFANDRLISNHPLLRNSAGERFNWADFFHPHGEDDRPDLPSISQLPGYVSTPVAAAARLGITASCSNCHHREACSRGEAYANYCLWPPRHDAWHPEWQITARHPHPRDEHGRFVSWYEDYWRNVQRQRRATPIAISEPVPDEALPGTFYVAPPTTSDGLISEPWTITVRFDTTSNTVIRDDITTTTTTTNSDDLSTLPDWPF